MDSYKLVILGDGGVGKTALTIQMCLNQFVESYDPTIEDSYRKQATIDGKPCVLEILDTAGQEEYTALRDQWIRDGSGFLLVYAVTQRSSFERITRFRDQILRVKQEQYVPIVIVGNKSDITQHREVSVHEGSHMAAGIKCDFVETSARTCENVEHAFFNAVRLIRRQEGANRYNGNSSIQAYGTGLAGSPDSGYGVGHSSTMNSGVGTGKHLKNRRMGSNSRINSSKKKQKSRCLIL